MLWNEEVKRKCLNSLTLAEGNERAPACRTESHTYRSRNTDRWRPPHGNTREWHCVSKAGAGVDTHATISIPVEDQQPIKRGVSWSLSAMSSTTWLNEDSQKQTVSLPEWCRNKHSSCCGWLPEDCRRTQRSLQLAETPTDCCSDTECRCHCGIWKNSYKINSTFPHCCAWIYRLGAYP